MNGLKRLSIWGLCLLLTFVGSTVSAATTMEQIHDLYQQGRIDEAYKLANQYLPEGEGNPEFDFLYGRIAIDSGDLSLGVFALERVLMVKPSHHFAQLELARGYYLLGQADRAKEEFEQVLEANPSAAIRSKIAEYLKAVKVKQSAYKTTTTAYSEFTLGYDTNINSASGDATFVSPTLGTGTLSDDSLANGSIFGDLEIGGFVSKPVAEGRFLFSGIDFGQRVNADGSEYDLSSLKLQGGFNLVEGDRQLRLSLAAQHLAMDYDSYRSMGYVTADGQYLLSPTLRLNAYLQGGAIGYTDLENRDVYTFGAGIGLTHALNTRSKPVMSAMFFVGHDEPMTINQTSKELADKNSVGLLLKNTLTMTNGDLLDFSMMVQSSSYYGEDSVFLVKREDDYFKFSAGYTRQINSDWKLKLEVSHSQLNSNIPIYEYDRTEVSMGVRYEY